MTRLRFGRLTLTAFGVCVGLVHGQGTDPCEAVLRYAANDVSNTSYYDQVAFSTFENSCGANKGALNVSVLFKGVPIGAGVENQNEFCHTFSEKFERARSYYLGLKLVNPEAVHAWSACRMAQVTAKFIPTITDQLVTIEVRQNGPTNIQIKGFRTTGGLTHCKAPSRPNEGDFVPEITIGNGDNWTVSCTRKTQASRTGTTYLGGTITIDVRQGNLVLEIPEKKPPMPNTSAPPPPIADWSYVWLSMGVGGDQFKTKIEEFLNANRPRRGGIAVAISPGNPSFLHIWARADGDGPKWTARTIPEIDTEWHYRVLQLLKGGASILGWNGSATANTLWYVEPASN